VAERFTTTIELQGKTATFFAVPLDVRAVFGRARPPVRVTIGGHTYRSTVAVYGDRYFLPLNRANRAAAGVAAGDTVLVEVEADDELRTSTCRRSWRRRLRPTPRHGRPSTPSPSPTDGSTSSGSPRRRGDTKLRRATKAVEDLRAGKTR
jgi:hypothetical protein